ncbi:hypothetical protein, partial [Lysobacter claricitrinus]|uniref:hypothetical protein n=1 Tax=Lysobacter claricitrinus TaxID=3367728 RepID=UPI0038B28F40
LTQVLAPMKRILAAALMFVSAAAYAERDTQSVDFTELVGASKLVSCSPDGTCTFWVRLPENMKVAWLVSSANSRDGLWVPLNVATFTPDEIAALVRPGPTREYVGESLHGVRFQASSKLCKELELWVKSDSDSSVEFIQGPLSAWTRTGR